MRFSLSAIGVGSVAVAAIAAACQTYDFEPVEPLALQQDYEYRIISATPKKANVLLVVDKSGSMLFPVNPSNPSCPTGCGPQSPCPANCPTRLQEMKGAMGGFLTGASGSIARFGLAVFPDADPAVPSTVCQQGRTIHPILTTTDEDIALAGASATINDTIQAIGTPGGLSAHGGTPTAATVRMIDANVAAIGLSDSERANVVVLLTDGLPNCSTAHDGATCACVPGSTCAPPAGTNLSCLDYQAAADAVSALFNRPTPIKTIVVGFGAETGAGSVATTALNAMASAGGEPRKCQTAAECGGTDTCNGGVCSTQFYQAANGAELAAVLDKLKNIVTVGEPCLYKFDTPPSDPSFVVVYVDDQKVAPGPTTWQYTDVNGPTVELLGDLCTKVKTSAESDVVVRALRTF